MASDEPWVLRPPQPMLPGWRTDTAPCGCARDAHVPPFPGGEVVVHRPGCREYPRPAVNFRSPEMAPPRAIRLAARRLHQLRPEIRYMLLVDPRPARTDEPYRDARLLAWYGQERATLVDLWAVAALPLS